MRQIKLLFTTGIITGLWLGAGGCQHPKVAQTQTAIAAQSSPSPAKSIADLDDEVLETVFTDLLTLGGKESPLAVRGNPPENIRLAEVPATYPVTVDAVLKQHDPKLWDALSEADMISARQAAENLVGRHESRKVAPPFASKDPRVVRVASTTAPISLADLDRRPVQAWLPGYSADHRFAAVQLSIPWSMHHADGTYLLRWDEGSAKWVIVLRQFVYYV